MKRIVLSIVQLLTVIFLNGQQNEIIPDSSKCDDATIWILHNREISIDKEVHLDGKPGNGLLWIKEPIFTKRLFLIRKFVKSLNVNCKKISN